MKVYLGVNTLKGLYKECYYDGNTVKAVLDRVIPELEKCRIQSPGNILPIGWK